MLSVFTCPAIAIYKPQDVRPILEVYHGKDIALEYAKKEAEAKQKHIEEWEKNRKTLSANSFTFSGLFGSSQVSCLHHSLAVLIFPVFSESRLVSRPADISRAKAPRSPDALSRGASLHCHQQGQLRQAHQRGTGGVGETDAQHILGCDECVHGPAATTTTARPAPRRDQTYWQHVDGGLTSVTSAHRSPLTP